MAELTILEPISTGDVIDRAIRLYRRNFIPLISVVAVPALIYYASAMMVSFGYAQTLQGAQAGFNPAAILITLLGLAGYVVYMFAILSAVCGMCRAIGDHMMLGDPITFRGCWRFARRRLGDVAIAGLLSIPILSILGVVIGIVFVVLFMGVAFLIGIGGAMGLPPWLAAISSAVLLLASALLFVALMLLLAARLVFIPQALMIEGRSAAAAIGRAFQLGAGRTWYRLGMIGVFSYFVNLAILAALVQPLMIIFWMNGWAVADLLLQPGWNAVYAAVNQIAGLLVWPIWITSFTILYFDTRVRKEGYDIELITTGLPAPAHTYAAGMPVFRPPVVQWGSPVAAPPREYMQTGPLGLGGYPVTPQVGAGPRVEASISSGPNGGTAEDGPSAAWDVHRANPRPGTTEDAAWLRPGPGFKVEGGSGLTEIQPEAAFTVPTSGGATPSSREGQRGAIRCAVCGLAAIQGAKYCIACGDLLQTDEPNLIDGSS